MAAARTSRRCRQHSVRVRASIGLLSVATAAVLASLPAQSPLWLSLASVTALALAWSGLRIMWTEVLQSRRENAADRAAAAAAYRRLHGVRAAEHAEFTTAMTGRLAEAHLSQRELEGLVTQQETRAQRAESKLVQVQVHLQAVEEALFVLRSERRDGFVELVAWKEQAALKSAQKTVQKNARKRPALKQAQ